MCVHSLKGLTRKYSHPVFPIYFALDCSNLTQYAKLRLSRVQNTLELYRTQNTRNVKYIKWKYFTEVQKKIEKKKENKKEKIVSDHLE